MQLLEKTQPHCLLSKTLFPSGPPGWCLCCFRSFHNKSSADRASPSAQRWHWCQLNSVEIDFSGIHLRILRFPWGFYTLELLRWFVWYQHPAGPPFWHNHVKYVITSSTSRTNSFVHSFHFYLCVKIWVLAVIVPAKFERAWNLLNDFSLIHLPATQQNLMHAQVYYRNKSTEGAMSTGLKISPC